MELAKKYDSKQAELKWQQFWEKQRIYAYKKKGKNFAIDTPPPTVSGKMHLGHAFSYTQQDFIARYKRMRGLGVFFPFGTDDNGLATEKLVQKEKKVNLRKVPRIEAIKICLDYLKEIRPDFIADWKKIGMSCDFEVNYSTIDDNSRKISQKSFLDLHKKNLVYRKEAPIIWDTQFQTAIAQAELESVERESYFQDLIFVIDEENVRVATTRPELLGACVAVMVNPEDERFQHLVGKEAITPLYKAKVPVLADERVDMEKGTGIVMCCTFGDLTDIEWFKEFNLPLKAIMGKDGKLTEVAGDYAGMSVDDARKAIVKDLEAANLLENRRKVMQIVNVGERSNKPVEFVHSKQWYVKYLDRKDDFLKAVDKLEWQPKHMKHRADNWIKGLQWDWSISRQRHFGVPIPVWYDKEGKIYYADESQLPVDPTQTRPLGVPEDVELFPETDVFDTWFTSSSTPFLACNLVEDDLFPMQLRPQGHDIINFWLFYTLAKTQLIEDVNPWERVTISGFTLDPHGRKMSKSKGNVVDPQDLLEKYSADAIRFWSAGCKLGDDVPYQEKDVITGQKFVNKIWNSARFTIAQLDDFSKGDCSELMDKWVMSKLAGVIKKCTEAFDNYEYAKAKAEVENFFWHTFCDQYLEVVKDRLYNPDVRGADVRNSAQVALYNVLYDSLRLLAPFLPYVTEEIYRVYFKQEIESIHLTTWPEASKRDEEAENVGDLVVEIINAVRKYKSEQKISLKEELSKLVVDEKSLELIKPALADLKAVLHVKDVIAGEGNIELENVKISIEK